MNVAPLNKSVWLLLFSTALSRASLFMSLPFLAIVMTKHYNAGPIWAGVAAGAAPLFLSLGGFFGGNLGDRFGRSHVLLISLGLHVLLMLALGFTSTPLMITMLCALLGCARACFEPNCQALISDLTPIELRKIAFSYRYLALNIGCGVGPIAGVLLSGLSPTKGFLGSAALYLLNLILVCWMFHRSKHFKDGKKSQTTLKKALHLVATHRDLRRYTMGALLVFLGYSQLTSSLPQILGQNSFDLETYSLVLSLNSILIIVGQHGIGKVTEKLNTGLVTILGSIISGIGLMTLGCATSLSGLVTALVIFTFGEMLFFPNHSLLVDRCATNEERGSFFGASGLSLLGYSFGPIIGGSLLSRFPGFQVLTIISTLVLLSAFYFRKSR